MGPDRSWIPFPFSRESRTPNFHHHPKYHFLSQTYPRANFGKSRLPLGNVSYILFCVMLTQNPLLLAFPRQQSFLSQRQDVPEHWNIVTKIKGRLHSAQFKPKKMFHRKWFLFKIGSKGELLLNVSCKCQKMLKTQDSAPKGGFPLSRNFYIRTGVKFMFANKLR